MVEFGILGPLEVRHDGRRLDLGGPKRRVVLAALLLRAGEPVSADLLIEALWGDEAPPSAARTLHVHVSRIRAELGSAATRLVTTPAGYRLDVAADELDARRFERLSAHADEDRANGRLEPAATKLAEALSLWRGPALADLRYESFAQADIARLEELRWSAVEERLSVELELGRHRAVLREIEPLAATAPLRERLVELRMRALYHAGRHVDALAAYRDASRRLNSELGLEPGPSLRELERAILTHDPSLADPGASGRPPRAPPSAASYRSAPKRRPVALIGRVLILCAAVFLIGWAAIGIAGATRAGDDRLDDAINALRREGRDAGPMRMAIVEYVNSQRLASGSVALEPDARLEEVGQALARRDAIHAKSQIGTIREAVVDMGWSRVDESVATGTEWPKVPPGLLDKSHERGVMTSSDFTKVGIGVAFGEEGKMWIHAVVAG